jgi:aspartate--ammonia ligase
MFPELRLSRYPNLPEEVTFLHAEELLAMYPDLRANAARPSFCRSIPPSSSWVSGGPC